MRVSLALKCAIVGVGLSSGIGTVPARAQETTLRVHYYVPAGAPIARNFVVPWSKAIESESNGRIKFELYPSMQLGGTPSQLFDQAKDNVVDIVLALPGGTPGRFPKSEVIELPFIAGNAQQSSQAVWELYQKHLKDEFDGVQMLAAFAHSPGVLHVKGKGIHKLEDMQGLKLRGPSRLVNKVLETLGATPVGMPMPAVPDALSKGVIDGTLIPWEVVLPLRVQEIVKTHTEFSGNRSLYVGFLILAMNKKKYDSLPPDLKAIIDKHSGLEVSRRAGEVLDEADKFAIAAAKKRQNDIVVLDAAETARWKQGSEKVYAEWVASVKDKGIDGRALIDDMKAMVSKYAGPAN
jgi:TRAP-type C4-dicarboxylate transport system substrate-binding protein